MTTSNSLLLVSMEAGGHGGELDVIPFIRHLTYNPLPCPPLKLEGSSRNSGLCKQGKNVCKNIHIHEDELEELNRHSHTGPGSEAHAHWLAGMDPPEKER